MVSVIKSRRGSWYSGPWPKTDSTYRWVGPYERKADCESDQRGLEKFLKKTSGGP